MVRQIIQIDEEKCNGCGLCAHACHEGAIGIVNGKAKLLRDDYCDGMGDCLPECPTGAISFVRREAAAYDESAVAAHKQEVQTASPKKAAHTTGGCPGSRIRHINRSVCADCSPSPEQQEQPAALTNWPVQIKLAPVRTPYFEGARLLIAADCTAYSYAAFHKDFIRGKVTLIGCPKLDNIDYTEKLTEIIRANNIQSVTVVRMEVPCCGGLEAAAEKALQNSGKFLPYQVVTVAIDGTILN